MREYIRNDQGIAKRIEWIKNLVLSLVNGPSSLGGDQKDAGYERTFGVTIRVVLESIQMAKEILFSGATSDLPMSVSTDLQMLEFIIQMKL